MALAVLPNLAYAKVESTSGHAFVEVTNQPEFGTAWKDESGVTWGDVAMGPDALPRSLNEEEAASYCRSIGATLPTREQFKMLSKYLGYGSASGYSPEILPHLDGRYYWSSSVEPLDISMNNVFYSGNGSILSNKREGNNVSVRCVAN